MKNMLSTAISIAALKHEGQLDKGGLPYILHPIRVMMNLKTSDQELMCIAVLHDTVEDTDVTLMDLSGYGMSSRVIEGVDALTKRNGESYEESISRVMQNYDAILVKREDLRDNSDLTRLKGVTEKDMIRMNKYIKAYYELDQIVRARSAQIKT